MVRYTDEELLEKLKNWAEINKKNPSFRDINKDKTIPSVTAYITHFGSINKAKELAGLETHGYTDEQLLEKLREWAKKHNRSPTSRDLAQDRTIPHPATYMRRFGSLNKAKELVGLEVNKNVPERSFTKEEILQKLIDWAKIHNKTPTQRDIDNDPTMPSVNTIRSYFDTFNHAKKLAELELFKPDSELNHVEGLLKEWKEGRRDELAEVTMKTYLGKLILLERFLEENGKTMQEMKFVDVKKYVLEIKEEYAKKTMLSIFNAIRNFLRFFLRKAVFEKTKPIFDFAEVEYVDTFFKKQLRQMEDDAEEDPALSEEEVIIIKKKLRDYPLLDIMLKLDLNLGLRASEFVKIKVTEGLIRNRKEARKGDIWLDLNKGILMIYRRKSRRPHLVALTREMIQLVKKQLNLRKLYGVNHEYLFFSKTGKPLRKGSIFYYYRQISKIVGFRITSHKVRRTMSTMLEKRGVPHSIIRLRMGHKPKDSTQLYQRYPIRERQKILEEKVGVL